MSFEVCVWVQSSIPVFLDVTLCRWASLFRHFQDDPFVYKTFCRVPTDFHKIPVPVISSFRREVDDDCVLLGYYTAISGNNLPTFRVHQSPIFRFLSYLTLKMGQIGGPETSVRNYHYWLRNNPEERSSQGVPILLR